jgi:hypothetical protein
LEGTGYTPEDYETDPVEVWPEHAEAIELFQRMGRRWVVGMSGPVALDFNVLFRMMDRMNLSPKRYDELETEITILEGAALEEMHKK